MRADKPTVLVVTSALLMLSSISLLCCPTAGANNPRQAVVSSSPSSPPSALSEDDDEGDELLEHWGKPVYIHEARVQIGGLVGVLLGAAAGGVLRRQKLKRIGRHA